jgi:hypothetical protein
MSTTTWLLRLYPAAWRARYGAEFTELLLARPPSARDRLDIVRGAVDARLHPQLTEDPVIRVSTPADRLLALAGVVAGALFTGWAAVLVAVGPRWGAMELVDEGLMAAAYGALVVAMILAVCVVLGLATRYLDELGSFGAIAAVTIAIGFLLTYAGAGPVAVVVLSGGTVALVPGLARVARPLVGGFLGLMTILVMLAMFGFVGSGGQATFFYLWMCGYGPAWILVGFSLRKGRRVDLIAVAERNSRTSESAAGA